MDLNLKNKTVLITGASGGIGAATARIFHQEGAFVVLHYNQNTTQARNLSKELPNSLAIKADLADEEQVLRMFSEISTKRGRIDILVCNAGIWPEDSVGIVDMDYQRWKHTLAVDLDSVFLCTRGFLKQLITYQSDYASVILVGSTAGVFGEAGHADYSASKAAMTYGLTRSLKNEIVHLARLGRVNAVCPGWTVTPMTEKFLDDEKGIKNVCRTIPLRKIAQAEDIAGVITVLASDTISGHVSGQIITVAGGMEGRSLFDDAEIDFKRTFKPLH